jgi:type II secretion system protein N
MSRPLRIALYGAFFFIVLVLAVLVTFPWDTLARRIEEEVARSSPGTTLVIGEIGPSLPVGVRLANVVYQSEGKNGAAPSKWTVDRIRLKPVWWSLLRGRPGVSFAVDLLSGQLTGSATKSKEGTTVSASFDHMLLDEGKVVEEALGVPLAGTLHGSLEATATADGKLTTAHLLATVDDAKVKGGKVAGFTLPTMDLGRPEVDLVVEKGEAKLVKCEAKGKDVTLTATATSTLRPQLGFSPVKGQLKVKPAEAFLDKNPALKAGLSLAGSFKKPDGSLEFPLNGTLSKPVSLPGFGGPR